MPRKNANQSLWLTSTDTSLTSSQVAFFRDGFDTFSFFMRACIEKAEEDYNYYRS